MVRIQFDLPRDVDKYLRIQKAKRDMTTKAEVIIFILKECMKEK